MKCQKCNEREATTHIQKIINGKKTEYHLCNICAAEVGEFPFSLKNDFDALFGGFFGNSLKQTPLSAQKACPNCNMTLSEFLKSGRLGCSSCYESFKDSLSRPLRQIHGATEHTGKIPRRGGKKVSTAARIRRLQSELAAAVENQEFETAARLRDEINALKEGGEK